MSLYEEMLELTVSIAKLFDLTPFEVFKQDKNHVLMMVDYFLSKDGNEAAQPTQNTPPNVENVGGYSDPMWNYI